MENHGRPEDLSGKAASKHLTKKCGCPCQLAAQLKRPGALAA
jgi:hypothetical protein